MTANEAMRIALQARSRFGVGEGFTPRGTERRIIELVGSARPVVDAPPTEGPVRDTVAWVVTLGEDVAEVELAIDEATGEVVRFRRSRGAAVTASRATRLETTNGRS
jgi:hypothetical protein